tara:strand:- start:1765 stop:4938 length:3174 start_codon:yes stop_codon:yes gene_type:complete
LLNLYKTNKIELITDVIANELLINPPKITEEVNIAVHNYYLGKWMRDQITLKNEISALCEFQTITKHTELILKKFYSNQSFNQWDYESIKWRIISNLYEFNNFKEAEPLMKWTRDFLENNKTINKDIYILCSKIAKIFTDYLLHRPELIYRWHHNKIDNKSLFKGLSYEEYWQPILYKLIEKNISEKPTCLYMLDFIENNFNYNNILKLLPKQFYVVAINNLSKLQINFYIKLSKITNINIYLLSPGYDLWNRIYTEEGIVDFSELEFHTKDKSQSIEKVFGSFGANFEKLVEESILEYDLNFNKYFPYVDPTMSINCDEKVSLLKQIQKRVIDNNNLTFSFKDDDNSLIFKRCLNYLDQLKFIRIKIQDIISSNKDIALHDIAIISPEIVKIKPYLKYIFNSNFELPYFYLIEDYREVSGIYNFLIEIIEVANKKISFSDINSLLSNETARDIFDFEIKEKDELLTILKECGFHWGLDSAERLGEYKNSLEWCIERITLGLIYDNDFYIKSKNLTPFIPKNTSVDLNKWIHFLTQIKKYVNLFRNRNNLTNWLITIREILIDFQNRNNTFNDEIKNINEILNQYSESLNSKINIDLNVLIEILNSCFSNRNSNPDRRKNEILIGDIEKVRLIPHKIIFLIDMNEDYYPRKFNKENMNLLSRKYRLGDPSIRDKDLYMFLELLISCREQLIITWLEYDNERHKLEISSQIRQLKNIICNEINVDLSKNFDGIKESNDNYPISKNKTKKYVEDLEKKFNKFDCEKNLFIDEEYKINELKNWFISPQLDWLNKKNIYPSAPFSHNANEEKISNFEKFKFFNNLFKEVLLDDKSLLVKLEKINIKERIISNGIIAPKNVIDIKEKELCKMRASLIEKIDYLKNIERKYIKSGSNKEEYFMSNKNTVELLHSKLNLTKRLEIWIRLLFISSLNDDIQKAIIIHRKDNEYKTSTLISPGKIKSNNLLIEYFKIYKNCSNNFLPIPPQSSFKYIEAIKNNKNPQKSFSETWLGIKNYIKGEREQPEMQICFGYDVEPDLFLSSKSFQNLSMKMYSELSKASEK